MEELKNEVLPARSKEIEEICGQPIPYEVDWDTLKDDYQALNFLDNLSCHRLNMALRMICQDDLGKQAVRDGIHLVKLKNVPDPASRSITLTGGVLEMHCAYASGASGMINDNDIRAFLEKNL